MSGNTFGTLFRITNWGESHGKAIGVVIDGCPPQVEINEADIQAELDRRKPGQSKLTTTRQEDDHVEILSGVFEGKTTGTPIALMIHNTDTRKEDYAAFKDALRPSHADLTYLQKYGIRDPFGGGRSSARLTAGHVAAGAIAKKILKEAYGAEIIAYVKQVKHIIAEINLKQITQQQVEQSIVRCPEKKSAAAMIALIEKTKQQGDSVGGVIECIVRNIPAGLGEPLFDKIEADLAKAMLAINATKGFEIGSGFGGCMLFGSEHNDLLINRGKKITTATNQAGGVLGGITNGMPLVFRVAFKPTATIQKAQKTITSTGKEAVIEGKGRHDPCVLPRAVPIVEAMAALVLCDHHFRQRAYEHR
ncbi:chorismate synthase [Candidatus Woesearchaeota archaeon]|nr:chorismate synthase [Candidatus Woesearchaeota archaeon]